MSDYSQGKDKDRSCEGMCICHVYELPIDGKYYSEDSDNDSIDDMIASILPTSWERVETIKADSLFKPEGGFGKIADEDDHLMQIDHLQTVITDGIVGQYSIITLTNGYELMYIYIRS